MLALAPTDHEISLTDIPFAHRTIFSHDGRAQGKTTSHGQLGQHFLSLAVHGEKRPPSLPIAWSAWLHMSGFSFPFPLLALWYLPGALFPRPNDPASKGKGRLMCLSAPGHLEHPLSSCPSRSDEQKDDDRCSGLVVVTGGPEKS